MSDKKKGLTNKVGTNEGVKIKFTPKKDTSDKK